MWDEENEFGPTRTVISSYRLRPYRCRVIDSKVYRQNKNNDNKMAKEKQIRSSVLMMAVFGKIRQTVGNISLPLNVNKVSVVVCGSKESDVQLLKMIAIAFILSLLIIISIEKKN